MTAKRQLPVRSGFAIFCPTVFQGTMPVCYDGDYLVVFATKLEAQREIADNQLIRIQQFLDGERDFDDAITTDEFALPVDVCLARWQQIDRERANQQKVEIRRILFSLQHHAWFFSVHDSRISMV